MNFFANFGRVNTISISKIAIKSHKLCIKTSFWYIPEIIAHVFNQQVGCGGGGGCQRFRYVTEDGGILLTLRTITRGGGGQEGPNVWNIDISSSNSPPSKRTKCHSDDKFQHLTTTSNNSDTPDDNLIEFEQFLNQQPIKERCGLAPEENLERNSAGLKNSQTKGVWHKSLEENHSAQIKAVIIAWSHGELRGDPKNGSRIGYFLYSKVREIDDRWVTETGARYKV